LPSPNLKPEVIEALRLWKKCWYKKWGELHQTEKYQRLNLLIEDIWKIEKKEYEYSIVANDYYAWHPGRKTLLVDSDRPSIISTLHEISHSLYGESELTACRYSVWLFKTVFPQSFNSLNIHGHMFKL